MMELLKQLYSIHAPTFHEWPLICFIREYISQHVPEAEVQMDGWGNLYIKKGEGDGYPTLTCHLDQVQIIHSEDFEVREEDGMLYGWSEANQQREGLGADDKNGIWICLRCLEECPCVKVFMAVGEEKGCIGSSRADMSFFSDSLYVLEPDCKGGQEVHTNLKGVPCASDEFIKALQLEANDYTLTDGKGSDIFALTLNGIGVSCTNIPAGYHHPHKDDEYCVIAELEHTLSFIRHFVTTEHRRFPHIFKTYTQQMIEETNYQLSIMMKGLSKSRYTAFCQCPKLLWLKIYKPEEAPVDESLQARFEQGNKVGDLAMKLFGDYKEADAKKPDGSLDLGKMVEQTRQWMQEGVDNICEASFALEGHYCAVDILRKNGDGWDIYEVKSTSFPEFNGQEAKLEKYAPDIAYQKWVLMQCGVNVTGTYLVCLNSDYVRQGDLDIQQLFVVNDMKAMVDNEYLKVPARVSRALKYLNSEQEPDIDLSECCMKPYGCAFFDYCKRQHSVPSPSVFDLYGVGFSFKKKLDCYHRGQITFEGLRSTNIGPIQNMQIEAALTGKEFINPAGIRQFLEKITYPIYFLDFETMQDAVPQYDGAKVYAQITFQYSLHIKERPDEIRESHHDGRTLRMKVGKQPIHKEYLAPSDGSDPRRALAEQLCKDIPKDACTLAYNKMFERGRILELAALYPDLSDHLANIANHIIDLIDPFRAGDYYVPAMGGSFSIKSVLPALFPGDPELDYHNLDDRCQNGGDAMTIFPRIKDMAPEEARASRQALLNYCKLDTWAMVKVWEKLKEVAGLV